MLILSRRNGESFIIGDDIKITVLSQRSNQVRIGIEAPRSLPVHREEVLLRQTKQGIVVENVSPQESFPSKISSDTPSKTTQKEAVLED